MVERDLCINTNVPKGITSSKVCEKCGKPISLFAFNRHAKACEKANQPPKPRQAWNRGLTKETSPIVSKISETNHRLSIEGKIKKRIFTEENRKHLSDMAKERCLGGYRPHPNRGVRYRGIWFDSKWEVRVAKILDDNNIRWERPKIGFVWTDDGRKYYPDFFLPDRNLYLDPKNDYLIEKDAFKIAEAQRRNSITVKVLNGSQLNWEYLQTLL